MMRAFRGSSELPSQAAGGFLGTAETPCLLVLIPVTVPCGRRPGTAEAWLSAGLILAYWTTKSVWRRAL